MHQWNTAVFNSTPLPQLGEDPHALWPAAWLAQVPGCLATHHHWNRAWNQLLPGPRIEASCVPQLSDIQEGFLLLYQILTPCWTWWISLLYEVFHSLTAAVLPSMLPWTPWPVLLFNILGFYSRFLFHPRLLKYVEGYVTDICDITNKQRECFSYHANCHGSQDKPTQYYPAVSLNATC